MKKGQVIRPYLKCRLKFDWHVEPLEVSSNFLNALAEFLVEKGFKRPEKNAGRGWKKLKRKELESSDLEKASGSGTCIDDKKPVKSCEDAGTSKENPESIRKTTIGMVGMRSVLRNMQRGTLSAVFFDADNIKPSSVATTLGLLAVSLQNTKVYAIPGLNGALSNALFMPKVGAVGLMDVPDTQEICKLAASILTNVGILNKQKSFLMSSATEVQTPVGKKKIQKKKKMKKKQKQKK